MTVDFHTHVLPEVDDGSKSLEESLQMLELLARQNVTCVVATPHFYANHNDPRRFLARRQQAVERLTEAMAQSQGMPSLRVGAEVYYFEGISDAEVLQDLAISGTNCVLVEMPMPPWSDRVLAELSGIEQKQGLVPVIAHIDRYIAPFQEKKISAKLSRLPVLVQANASFFKERRTRKLALRMLMEGKIHLLGSDCHNMASRKPNLEDAVNVISHHLGADVLEQIRSLETQVLEGKFSL